MRSFLHRRRGAGPARLILLWQIARGERFEPEDTEDALADAPVS